MGEYIPPTVVIDEIKFKKGISILNLAAGVSIIKSNNEVILKKEQSKISINLKKNYQIFNSLRSSKYGNIEKAIRIEKSFINKSILKIKIGENNVK